MWIANVHIRLRPIPQRIELRLMVQLHRDHHPVRHSLGARVVIGPVGQVSQRPVSVFAHLKINRLGQRITVEELLIGGLNLLRDFAFGMTELSKNVAVVTGSVGSCTVAIDRWRCPDADC